VSDTGALAGGQADTEALIALKDFMNSASLVMITITRITNYWH